MRYALALFIFASSVAKADVLNLGTGTLGAGGSCGGATVVRTSTCILATASLIPDRDGNTGTIATLTANLKVSEPDGGGTPIGTVVLFAGGGSSGFFETLSNTTGTVVLPLLASGWRVIQFAWSSNGGFGSFGGSAGSLYLSGRTATVMNVIHSSNTLYTAGTPFVVVGQSGGASQIAYMLSHYGAGDYIDTAVMCSGPPHARQDYGAMSTLKPSWLSQGGALLNVSTQAGGQLGYAGGDAALMDAAYGSQTATQVRSFDGGTGNYAFKDSIMNGTATYRFPKTNVYFVFGDGDTSCAVPSGKLYAQSVIGKTTTINNTTGNVQHTSVPGSSSGSTLILNAVNAATFNH